MVLRRRGEGDPKVGLPEAEREVASPARSPQRVAVQDLASATLYDAASYRAEPCGPHLR